ncbi:hypothetical protein F52700_3179 [Fusarium sp. NRRL 52700]|nr:hypothetical protein F52700_3179 [Fusarium sp. NRRL 52700]
MRIFPPTKPRGPGVDVTGAKAGFWNKDLKPSKLSKVSDNKAQTSKTKGRNAKKIAEDEAERAEARKKGKTAYLTVNIIRGAAVLFQWKDKKGTIWSIDDVTFQPGWDLDRAEFEAKLAYDSYWGHEMEQYNRRLVIYSGRVILQASAQAVASGLDYQPTEKHLHLDLWDKPLTRDIEEAMMVKIRRHKKMLFGTMGVCGVAGSQ